MGELGQNPATIGLAKFFAYVCASSIGFERVAVLAIGLVRKGAVNNSRFHIFGIFFHFFSPYGTHSPFQINDTHTHRKVK